MSRLTKFYPNDFEKYGFTKPCDDMEHLQLVADKLGQLEDIEEELGIDLVTLFKSVFNGFYVKDGNGITFVHKTDVKEKLMVFKEALFKDYGKTWALTKEELE